MLALGFEPEQNLTGVGELVEVLHDREAGEIVQMGDE